MPTSTDLVPLEQTDPGDLLAALAAAFVATRRSENTRAAYRRDLGAWLDYAARAGFDPLDAWPGNVQLWLAELDAAGESGTTRARRLAAVSSWYGWLIRHERAARNPAAALDAGERPVRSPKRTAALSDVDAGKLLDAADADSTRAAALVWLLLFTGARVGAVLAADVDSVGIDRGYPVIDLPEKGGKTLRKTLVPPVFARVDAYLQSRTDLGDRLPALAAGAAPARPLIATRTGGRLDRKEVRRLLRRLARAAGLPDAVADQLTPHTTRATYVTSALEAGVPVRDVQYAVGHASPVTTEGYDRSSLSPDREPGFPLLRQYKTGRNRD
ncbi:site-specific tyrosine recombinase XerD [Dactylosporangium matsuzakiense]|uniref:tyrosine-type recombinase/integrase n=1 Tax=Dactylosporangium matsuzakiense TaxID=53360 RepID=UPI0031ED9E75